MQAARGYSRVFSESPVAPLLSRPSPVRRTGFERDVRVERRVDEAEGVVSLTFADTSGGVLPRWEPGAHLDVRLPSGAWRQYSLCGDPADAFRYRIAVRRIADGSGSGEIHDAVGEGAVLRIRGPRNAFPFATARSYVFVAAGIGITPILPMVRAATAAGSRWRLVYTGRSRASMPFLDELGELGGDVRIRPDDEYGTPTASDLLGDVPRDAQIYVCGPPPLLDAARAHAGSGALHTERFSPPPVVGGSPFEVHLARTRTTVRVAPDESALDAIRRAVPGTVYSCRQGFCGTCKVRVLDGAVDHRDTMLPPDERADSMLVCVSRARDSTLTIDL
ncbi:oxidoreductase [Rhodococcus sp. HNM0569]|nr:PDR/VanB family oxidoreductase [Rhodococcus sp. HNM0569]NLU83679.1 oxidoreductase [Rhodococcus sp. HNM0569]